MANPLTDDIYTMKTTKTVSLDDGISWEQAECPHCGVSPMFVVATALDGNIKIDPNQRTRWLRCTHCLRGSVNDRGTLHPASVPLREPGGLPAEEAAAWSEVRQSLRTESFLAVVLLSRAIIRRLAASSDLPDASTSSFEAVVDHLVRQEYLTSRMRGWAERLAPTIDRADDLGVGVGVDAATSRDVASFTLRALEAYYELDELMGETSDR